MELRLSLGPDEYGSAGKKMMSRERDVGLLEFHLGSLGGRRPPEEVISSDPTSEDRNLPLLLPLLGGRRNLGEIAERSKEGTVSSAERKKLRLSKEQSSFLEQCFREHHTLTSSVKLDIAKQLNLRPRQVEVWFQNRRARTKLKHMEEDCSFLRRQCEWLTEENMRLRQELLRLRELNALPAVSDPQSSTTPESIPCTSCTHFRPTTTFAPTD